MAARTPDNTEPAAEQLPEQAIQRDPVLRRWRPRKGVLITVIAAVAVIVLAVAGWLVYTNIKQANELAAAKGAYETALGELSVAQDAAKTANAQRAATSATLSAHVAVAEVLTAQLGDGTDLLKAAVAAVEDAAAVLADAEPNVPAKSAGALPETPDVADYDALREKVAALIAVYEAHAKTLTGDAAARDEQNTRLLEAWRAQAATATDTANATVVANPNAAQEAKDAVTAAAQAIVELENPLDDTTPGLWQALRDTTDSVVAAEKAHQAQKAAEAEAARRAAPRQAAPGKPGGGGSGSSSGGSGSGGGYSMADMEASFARQKGVAVSDVHCAVGTPPAGQGGTAEGEQGILCTFSTGDRSGWHWFGLG